MTKTAMQFRAFQRVTEYSDRRHVRSVKGLEAQHGPFKRTKIDANGATHATDQKGFQRVFAPHLWDIRKSDCF